MAKEKDSLNMLSGRKARDPELYVTTGKSPQTGEKGSVKFYTCPMDPEVLSESAGLCPKCGMALEPQNASLQDEENPELDFMNRRLRVGLYFTFDCGRGNDFRNAFQGKCLDSVCSGFSCCSLGGVAFFPESLGIDCESQTEYVYADCFRYRDGIYL